MRRSLLSLAALALACSSGTGPPDAAVPFDARAPVVSKASSGGPLAAAASPVAAVAQHLRARGASEATAASIRQAALAPGRRGGITHARIEQSVGGLRIAGAYARAAVDAQGRLVHLVDATVPVSGNRIVPAAISERDALVAALAALHPAHREPPSAGRRQGVLTTFDRTGFFHVAPTVERVALLLASGDLGEGFVVQTWTARDNQLHLTTVDGHGRLVDVEARTANDRYAVFPRDPVTSPQTVVEGPGPTSASPLGWLEPGTHRSIAISGNNVRAYLDATPDGIPDAGGAAIANGDFLALADLGVSPSEPVNRDVAIQNLFYLNNLIHDVLHEHGFDEVAGNFQRDNFGRGGRDGDPVQAEGQDGGGIDNANFATPVDGFPPRMQMYLWTGKGDHQVLVQGVGGPTLYRAQGAAFGPALDPTGVTGGLAVVNDGTGDATDGCEPPQNDVAGRVAVVDRGTCNFTVKVKNAQVAGAIAVVVVNVRGDSLISMGGADPTVAIPSVLVGLTDGTALKLEALASVATATVRRTDPPPLLRDGDLDSDIVWHEYGHGLTWRMIGRMQGPLAGAVGEGMSDVLALVVNEDDTVGEYAFDDPIGIRRFPYAGYPLTYANVQGTEVHDDGEVYAAIGWRMFELYREAGISKEILLDDLLDGMNYTPQSPKFEDMRDGILASLAATGGGRACLVWSAFARYGVGVGASAQAANGIGLSGSGGPATTPVPNVRVTASFAVPPQCAP